MEKESQNYYPESLSRAIDDYEKGQIPGLVKARQELSREVIRALHSSNKDHQQKAIEGLLEAIELRMFVLSGDFHSDLEALEADFKDQLKQGE